MTTFRYRAVTAQGATRAGMIEDGSWSLALDRLRRSGLTPIEVTEAPAARAASGPVRPNAAARRVVANAISELAVLLGAGLTLDRALAVAADNIARPAEKAAFIALGQRVKEGATLSRAMAEAGNLFPPLAWAMAEAGEANGRLDEALAKLAETLERGESLRQTIGAAMVYPIMLLIVAALVILTMLLWVIPQFEGLFSDAGAKLPMATRIVMGASHAVRSYGLIGVAVLAAAGFVANAWLRRPSIRAGFDRWVLRLPRIGTLVTAMEVGRFARVLGSLVEGGVPLPDAVAITRRTLGNAHLSSAIGRVATRLKQGAGLTASLAAEDIFPNMALSFIRTGEETARLGPMLGRLADALDREIRIGVEQLIAILTPLITVAMGAIVGGVIASIMTAILGFNDLALAP